MYLLQWLNVSKIEKIRSGLRFAPFFLREVPLSPGVQCEKNEKICYSVFER
jgi:hypothetical protein